MHIVSVPSFRLQFVSERRLHSDRICIAADLAVRHDILDTAIVLQVYTVHHNILQLVVLGDEIP
jgi:hypothetical protein